MWYQDFIGWMIANPHFSVPLLMFEYAASYVIYYKTGERKIIKTILALWFQPQNLVMNLTFMSVLCLDPAREFAITKRLQRYKKTLQPDTRINRWRLKVAYFFCDFANRWDPGHC